MDIFVIIDNYILDKTKENAITLMNFIKKNPMILYLKNNDKIPVCSYHIDYDLLKILFFSYNKIKHYLKYLKNPFELSNKYREKLIHLVVDKGDNAINNKMLLFLIDKIKVDINSCNISYETPIFYAVKKNNNYAFNLLLFYNAKINGHNRDSLSLLYYTIAMNNKEMFKKLLQRNIKINKTDINIINDEFKTIYMKHKVIHSNKKTSNTKKLKEQMIYDSYKQTFKKICNDSNYDIEEIKNIAKYLNITPSENPKEMCKNIIRIMSFKKNKII